MSFNLFSLDFLYYPVSGIMWVWHQVFGFMLGPNNAWAWVLSVMFMVFTLRVILFKPYLKQLDSQLKMQAVQPEMKKLREKYKDDRQRLTEEMMKLNKEHGVNPLTSCGPAIIQAPIFIALYHVLRMFTPIPDGHGSFSLRDNVYFFSSTDVHSFAFAKLFGGAPLAGEMKMPADLLTFLGGDRTTLILVGVPLTILAGLATHMTSRLSVARQHRLNPESAKTKQTALMNKLMLYGFPLFVVIGGPFFPMPILFYWLANNTSTFTQLYVAHKMQDRKLAAAEKVVDEAKEATRYTKPKPGAKPTKQRPLVQPSDIGPGADGMFPGTDGTDGTDGDAQADDRRGNSTTPQQAASGASSPGAGGTGLKKGVDGTTRPGLGNGKAAKSDGTASPGRGPEPASSPGSNGRSATRDGFSAQDLPPGMISGSSRPKPGAKPGQPRKKKPKR